MWKRWGWAAWMLVATGAAFGQGRGAVTSGVEASMLVTGEVEIAVDGKLEKMTIDKSEALPEAVVSLLQQASQAWTFKPTIRDGRPMRAKGPMTVRVVAKAIDPTHYGVRIRSATFGSTSGDAEESVSSTDMRPPRYPDDAARAGAAGSVYLVVRVGPDGKVDDVIAEQTNLTVAGTPGAMKAMRGLFEKASIAAARKWVFRPPTNNREAGADHWIMRIPVDFSLGSIVKKKYGEWETYIPGPRAIIPWPERDQALAGGDALADGGLYQIGSGPELLTPLNPG